jgi:hypothetical protein
MHEIIREKSYLKIHLRDSISYAQLIETITELYRHPDFPHSNTMWFISSGMAVISAQELDKIRDFIQENYPSGCTRTRTALVAPQGMNAALAQLFADQQDQLEFEAKVFHEEISAEAWLEE